MKKPNDKKQFPKFKSITLGREDLSKAIGGVMCTCDTCSVSHIDGTTDCDC